MSFFDTLVDEALRNQPALSSLRMVVEKELLHHDILRILAHSGLMKALTFMGGTCLRACYHGERLSEDLDFTGGQAFTKETLCRLGELITRSLSRKYDLSVGVSEPIKETGLVDTWKVRVETRPQQKNMPAQRINIDVCSLTSYEKQPMLLLNPYQVDMGTSGLVVQAQSREEIYADKLLAFALRPNRLKQRDIWDILWLHQLGVRPRVSLVPLKLLERGVTPETFLSKFIERIAILEERGTQKDFENEMRRFLPVGKLEAVLSQEGLWSFIIYCMKEHRVILKDYFDHQRLK